MIALHDHVLHNRSLGADLEVMKGEAQKRLKGDADAEQPKKKRAAVSAY